jgi:hypothetical protein
MSKVTYWVMTLRSADALHLLPSFRPFPTCRLAHSGTVRRFYRTFTDSLVHRRGEIPSDGNKFRHTYNLISIQKTASA